jgi:4-amino-4-deoxy-L-arabinose transferase-like glycosyltransferase
MDLSPAQILAVVLGTLAVVALILRRGTFALAAIFLLINVLMLFVLASVSPDDQAILGWPLLILLMVGAVQILLGQVIIFCRHRPDSPHEARPWGKQGPEA